MIRIEQIEVSGWSAALRGMRNPMNSWDQSDTIWGEKRDDVLVEYRVPQIGPKDLALAKKLADAGPDHGKFLRMITVSMDITAPMYWWAEFDTYKVGTVRNSCSKMHKIAAKTFVRDDFSHEHLSAANMDVLDMIITALNIARIGYMTSKDKKDWWQMIQLLPASYNQKATVTVNYQVLKNIWNARKDHKLDEWRDYCCMIEYLPYSCLITGKSGPAGKEMGEA